MTKVIINTDDHIDDNDHILDRHEEVINEPVQLDKGSGQSSTSIDDTDDDSTNIDTGSTVDNNDDSEELVEIDGVEYAIKDGNAVDKDGEIKYTAEQLKEFEGGNDDTITPSALLKLTNIQPVDENGTPIEYENTLEATATYINDVYNIAQSQAIEEFKNNLFTAYPAVIDFIEHLNNNNGSPEGFSAKPDYSNIKLDKDNEAQLKNIIISGRVARGESQEKAEKYYNYAKDSDLLLTEAEEELQYLAKQDEASRNAKLEADQSRIKEEREEAARYWGIDIVDGQLVDLNKNDSIYGIIKQGKIKVDNDTFTIPDKIRISEDGKVIYKTKDDFFKYLYEPVKFKQGDKEFTMTRYDYDLQIENSKRSVHNDILDAYRKFTKYDVSQLIKEKINQEEVKRAIKRYSTKQNKSGVDAVNTKNNKDKKIVIPGTI